MIIKKKWIDIFKSPEFIILIVSISIVTCCYIPWNKFHYGDVPQNVVYVDTSKPPTNGKREKTDSLNFKLPKKIKVGVPRNLTYYRDSKKTNTNNTKSQFNLPNTSFNGPTQFGNGNTQTNEFTGIKQRHLDKNMLTYILKNLGEKSVPIDIGLTDNSKETLNYAKEIGIALTQMGYSDVGTFTLIQLQMKYDTVNIIKGDRYTIEVFPASNTQQ